MNYHFRASARPLITTPHTLNRVIFPSVARSLTTGKFVYTLSFAIKSHFIVPLKLAATQAACNNDEPSFLQSVEKYYDHAADLSEVQPHTLAHLRAVDSVLRVTFPIEVENGKYEVIEGI